MNDRPFTKYVAGAYIITTFNGHRLPLIKKKYGPERNVGRWHFPGGKVKHGETITQAMARELWEETGIETVEQHWTTYFHYLVSDGEVFFMKYFAPTPDYTPELVQERRPDRKPPEKVRYWSPGMIYAERGAMVPNLVWLTAMALDEYIRFGYGYDKE